MSDEDANILAQRFLDGELSHAERRALLKLLGSRPDVLQRLRDDEAMLETVASLHRPALPADFVARTLARLPDVPSAHAARPASARRSVRRWALAAAAACVLLASGFWLGRESAPAPSPRPSAGAAREAPSGILVRLVLIEPNARSVALVGDFNGWDPARTQLSPGEGGTWTATLPLSPGRYHYMFLVDGTRWLADPLAAETSADGFGARNSVIDVEL